MRENPVRSVPLPIKIVRPDQQDPGRIPVAELLRAELSSRCIWSTCLATAYAKVAEGIKRDWQGALADYLERRECLRGLMLMMDIRHPLN